MAAAVIAEILARSPISSTIITSLLLGAGVQPASRSTGTAWLPASLCRHRQSGYGHSAKLNLKCRPMHYFGPCMKGDCTKAAIQGPNLRTGGDSRDQTGDLKLAKLALSQLSYVPIIDWRDRT